MKNLTSNDTPKENPLINENTKLLQGIQLRQASLNRLSRYLSELESQLALIFAASPDIIIFLDEEANILKASDAAYTILGYSREDMLNKSVWDFIWEHDLEQTKLKFEQVRQQKVLYFNEANNSFINHWVSKSGILIKLVWRFSLCDDREKQIIGVATDITQFGANNIYNFKLLQKAVNLSTDGVVIIENEQSGYRISYVNESYQKITGYTSEELIGKSCDMMHTEDARHSRALTTLKTCLKTGTNCDVLLEYRRKNGTIFYNRIALSAVKERGTIVNFIGVCRDITHKIGLKYEWSPNAESGFIHLSNTI